MVSLPPCSPSSFIPASEDKLGQRPVQPREPSTPVSSVVLRTSLHETSPMSSTFWLLLLAYKSLMSLNIWEAVYARHCIRHLEHTTDLPSPKLSSSRWGFPGGSAGKESACNAGDLGLIPGLARSPREGSGYPLEYSGLENSMDSLVHGVTESDMTERLILTTN